MWRPIFAAVVALAPSAAEDALTLEWPNAWPSSPGTGFAVPSAVLNDSAAPCGMVRQTVLLTVEEGAKGVADALSQFVEMVPRLLERLEEMAESSAPYAVLFGGVAHALQLALDRAQLLSLVAMVQKRCFSSAARLTLGRALLPLHKAARQQISTMWWMFDIGQYSNTNSPAKHIDAVLRTLRHMEVMFADLSAALPGAFARTSFFWGHEAHGMFINSTVIYRTLFPESAIVDKGLLRNLLRIFPYGSSVADFGALDGQYSKWLNDTGWVTSYAFDGVDGVSELTGGAVTQVDLAEALHIPWRPEPFDWVLCLEVAEHIPPDRESVFLSNLARHSRQGLILSWAPPDIDGEGHVNCQRLEDSRERVEALGFVQDSKATAALRASSEVPWIGASVAVYRRDEGDARTKTKLD